LAPSTPCSQQGRQVRGLEFVLDVLAHGHFYWAGT
jgi:hypothetical protein